jgi:membrane protease YdiL (CAAX protease family)
MNTVEQSPTVALGVRSGSVFEPLVLFAVFLAAAKYHEVTPLSAIQARWVGWNFNAHILMIILPVLASWRSGRNWSGIGIRRAHFSDSRALGTGLTAALEIAVVWGLLAAAPALLLGKAPAIIMPPPPFPPERAALGPVLTIVFTTVFCGVGEEIMFRGYLQARLNDAFGRPFSLMGVRFGWGLIISAALFGLGHGLAFWNPFADRPLHFSFAAGDAVVTCAEGFIFGLLYEKTNSIVAPALLHAAIGLSFGSIAFG